MPICFFRVEPSRTGPHLNSFIHIVCDHLITEILGSWQAQTPQRAVSSSFQYDLECFLSDCDCILQERALWVSWRVVCTLKRNAVRNTTPRPPMDRGLKWRRLFLNFVKTDQFMYKLIMKKNGGWVLHCAFLFGALYPAFAVGICSLRMRCESLALEDQQQRIIQPERASLDPF